MSTRVGGIIPARFASTRFPEKMLALVGGVPMVVATARQVMKAKGLAEVLVATDHPAIAQKCEEFSVPFVMTKEDHPSGTDRLAEVAKKRPALTHLINIQGDEPLMDPQLISALAKEVVKHPEQVVSACCPLLDEKEWRDPNAVKVVLRKDGRAMYFTRSPVPYPRQGKAMELAFKHIGIYAYERSLLLWFARQKPVGLEQLEALEQLRLLVLGKDLRMVKTNYRPIGVDTAEDLKKVNVLLKNFSK